MRVFVLCLGLLFGSVVSVFSLPVTFDFSLSPDAGENLNVQATSEGSSIAVVNWSANYGLGVDASTTEKDDSSKTLDGSSSYDILSFDFGSDVWLQEIVFTWVNVKDEFVLSAGETELLDSYIDVDQVGLSEVAFDFGSSLFMGSIFSIKADGSDDSFRIKSLTVDAPVPAPEPSTWLLLSVGIGGLAFWKRRH